MTGTNTKLVVLASSLLWLPGPRLCAQSQPFEEKARYEQALEQKVDEVLIRLLGPNQAKVVVEATMDFTRTEKLEITSEAAPAAGGFFRWQGAGGDAQAGDYLMPGFPAFAAGAPENKAYNRQTMSPSVFVKKMAVSIILNRDLPESEAESVRKVVSEMLLLDTRRGDQLLVIKAPFAPLWRTIWHTPEALSMALKYGILSVIAVIAMLVVAVGFLKLAGAMSTMAKAQQSHQITMELGKGAFHGGTETGLLPAPDTPGSEAPGTAAQEIPAAKEDDGMFSVTLPQVPFLVSMMAGEDPANVALVAGRLPREVKAAFLKGLPPAFSSDVITSMAKIRFVEPEIIATLKEELEKRLSGAVGGLEGALSAIESVDLRSKMNMLAELARKQPELAAEVRRRVLLPEDLGKLSEKEMSLLAGSVKLEEWAAALLELPEQARAGLKAQLAERAWRMLEQTMSYSAPTREKADEALARIMVATEGLIKEGRIANPSAGNLPPVKAGGTSV